MEDSDLLRRRRGGEFGGGEHVLRARSDKEGHTWLETTPVEGETAAGRCTSVLARGATFGGHGEDAMLRFRRRAHEPRPWVMAP